MAAAVAVGLGSLAACSPGNAPVASDSATSACAAMPGATQRFAEGTTVRMASTLQGVEAERFVASMAEFTECTGVSVELVSVDDLGEALRADDAASIYDLALLPQPGLLRALAEEGRLETMPSSVGANLEAGWDRLWADAVSVRDGEDVQLYGAPLMASLKSLVWFSPSAFQAAGYEVPTSWEELEALSAKIAADHADGAVAPWCVGLDDGARSGWVLSDWLEEALLQREGTSAYDAWVSHAQPVNSEAAVRSLENVGSMVLAEGRTPGGAVGARERSLAQAGEQLLGGECLMLAASSSFETQLPAGTLVTDAEGEGGVRVGAEAASGEGAAAVSASAGDSAEATASSAEAGPASGAASGPSGAASVPSSASATASASGSAAPSTSASTSPAAGPKPVEDLSAFVMPGRPDREEATYLAGGDFLVSLARTGAAPSAASSDGSDSLPTSRQQPSSSSQDSASAEGTGSAENEDAQAAREAVLTYLTSAQWAQARQALGGVASANRGGPVGENATPVARMTSEILQSRTTVMRIDGSDLMPPEVGTGTLWSELLAYAEGTKSASEALAEVEKARPAQ